MSERIGDSLESRLKEIERRLTIQEQTSRLSVSSVRDGTFIIQNANGDPMLILGLQDDGTYSLRTFDDSGNSIAKLGEFYAGGTKFHGFQLTDVNGRILHEVSSERGHRVPFVNIGLQQNAAQNLLSGTSATVVRPGTASAVFAEIWRGDWYSVGNLINYDFTFFPNGGSMSWEVLVYEYPSGTPTVTVSGSETGSAVQRAGTITIPVGGLSSGGTDPAGRYLTMRVMARHDSGGGVTADVGINAPPINYSF